MRQQGVMADWNDERGFGFISPAAGGPRVFAHVSAFPRGQRPASQDRVSYVVAVDEQNRPRASDVRLVTPTRSGPRVGPGVPAALAVAAVVAAGLVGLLLIGEAPVLVPLVYGLLSLVAFVMYDADKRAAQRGAWRVPEANLHLVALLGGWPGALVARHVFRHKTRKQPFRTVFWITVFVNCAALAWLLI